MMFAVILAFLLINHHAEGYGDPTTCWETVSGIDAIGLLSQTQQQQHETLEEDIFKLGIQEDVQSCENACSVTKGCVAYTFYTSQYSDIRLRQCYGRNAEKDVWVSAESATSGRIVSCPADPQYADAGYGDVSTTTTSTTSTSSTTSQPISAVATREPPVIGFESNNSVNLVAVVVAIPILLTLCCIGCGIAIGICCYRGCRERRQKTQQDGVVMSGVQVAPPYSANQPPAYDQVGEAYSHNYQHLQQYTPQSSPIVQADAAPQSLDSIKRDLESGHQRDTGVYEYITQASDRPDIAATESEQLRSSPRPPHNPQLPPRPLPNRTDGLMAPERKPASGYLPMNEGKGSAEDKEGYSDAMSCNPSDRQDLRQESDNGTPVNDGNYLEPRSEYLQPVSSEGYLEPVKHEGEHIEPLSDYSYAKP